MKILYKQNILLCLWKVQQWLPNKGAEPSLSIFLKEEGGKKQPTHMTADFYNMQILLRHPWFAIYVRFYF